MKKPVNDTQLLEQLLDRYKFARPVPDDIREEILSSKKKNLVRILKSVGAFSALYGALLFIYFALKKLGAGIPVAKFIISGMTAVAVTSGGYYAVSTLRSGDNYKTPVVEERRAAKENLADYKWVDQITLYNGRIIEGAIISRGAQYQVRTASGIISIPRNKIKTVKPLKVRTEPETGRPKPAVPITQ